MKITVPTREVHRGSGMQWHVYPKMETFCALINNPKISATLGLLEAGYYTKNNGCYGYAGPTSGVTYPISESSEFLVFQLDVSEEWIRDHKDNLDSIQVTPGGRGQRYAAFKKVFEHKQHSTIVTMGYFKNEFFDDAFSLFRRMGFVKKETDMIDLYSRMGLCEDNDSYDDDTPQKEKNFVIKRQICETDDDSLLIHTCNETLYTKSIIFKGLEIKLLSDDIEPNRSTLLELFANV